MNFTEKKLQRIFEGDRNIKDVKKRKKTTQTVDVKICEDYSAPVEISTAPLVKVVDGKKVEVPQTVNTTVCRGDALASNDGWKTTYLLKKTVMDLHYTEVKEEPKVKPFAKMNKAELLEVAGELEVVADESMTKAVIIGLIEAVEAD